MAATATSSVDAGALAGLIAHDAARRLAGALTSSFAALAEDEHGLSERQQHELIEGALSCWDGFELGVARELLDALYAAGVEAWGLKAEHAALLSDAAVLTERKRRLAERLDALERRLDNLGNVGRAES